MSAREVVDASGVRTHAGVGAARRALGRWMARPDVRAALLGTLGLRTLCTLVAAAIPLALPSMYPWYSPFMRDHFHLIHDPLVRAPPIYSPFDYLVRPWDRWDTVWFTDIAQHGYATYGSSFFMPLYPLLIHITAPLLGGVTTAAALFVSTGAAFYALLALYQLTERLAPGRGLGPYAVVVAVLLPTSFFLVAGYTESLFLALSLWAILAALDGHWGRVALLGGLAALTREQGVLISALAIPAAWALVRWSGERWRGARTKPTPEHAYAPRPHLVPLAAAAVPPLVSAAWIGILHLVLHVPLPWDVLAAPQGWNLQLTWPGAGLLSDSMALLTHPPHGLAEAAQSPLLDLTASLAGAAALALTARRLPFGLTCYLGALWCSGLIKVMSDGLTVSEGRYMLQLLPLCLLPAGWLARGGPLVRIVWLVSGTACLTLYLWIFVLWGYVS